MAYKPSYEYMIEYDKTKFYITHEKDPKKIEQAKKKLKRLEASYEKAIEREVNKALRF